MKGMLKTLKGNQKLRMATKKEGTMTKEMTKEKEKLTRKDEERGVRNLMIEIKISKRGSKEEKRS